jgi:hypothetical protein
MRTGIEAELRCFLAAKERKDRKETNRFVQIQGLRLPVNPPP